jgi:hypothetical protein
MLTNATSRSWQSKCERHSRHPLPDGVLQARTIYLVNKTGKQAILDSAYDEFQKWGRFTVTQNKDADLLVILSHAAGEDEEGATQMEIHMRGDEEAAYETTEAVSSGQGVYK